MKGLSARVASIEWLIDIVIIIFVVLSVIVMGLVIYGRSNFWLAAVLRNPNARNAIGALAQAFSTVVFIISTWFTYKLFAATKVSLELNRTQIQDQRILFADQKRLEFQREDIVSSTVKARDKSNPEYVWILIVYKSTVSWVSNEDRRDWRFRLDWAHENAATSCTDDLHFPFKILCIQHAEQFYELEFQGLT